MSKHVWDVLVTSADGRSSYVELCRKTGDIWIRDGLSAAELRGVAEVLTRTIRDILTNITPKEQ